jgi:endonuclease/exonuclease/phosphatase family metal-dependent hydrolase
MDRHLLTARCIIGVPNQYINIGNVHLESLNNARTREEQLGICDTILPSGKSILVGDFNFCSERNYDGSLPLENDCLSRTMPSYEDLWRKLKPEEKGFTFDSTANKMLKKYEQAR